MTPPNPLFSNSVTTMTTNSFHLPYLPDLTHYTYHCFLNTSSREKYTHTQTHTHLFFLHIHILAFKAIFSQFNSFLFIPTAFFLEMVKPPREGTASIYYIDNEEQLPTGLLYWTMGGQSLQVLEFQSATVYKFLSVWIFLEPQLVHVSLSTGQLDFIREFYWKVSDSNFKSEQKLTPKNHAVNKTR